LSGDSSASGGVDPVAALLKIVPHLRSEKKASKALSLLAALLRAHVPPADPRAGTDTKHGSTSPGSGYSQGSGCGLALELHGALAVACGEPRRVHDPSLRHHYAALLQAAFGQAPGSSGGNGGSSDNGGNGGGPRALSLFWPPQLRADVALWVVAGWAFNASGPPPPRPPPPGSSSASAAAWALVQAAAPCGPTADTFPVLVPVLAACVTVLLEAAEATVSSAASSAAGASSSAVSCAAAELYKARLVDVLQRLHDRFREPWATAHHRDQSLEVFETVLALPGSWWPPPNGKAQRSQVERWASSMAARR